MHLLVGARVHEAKGEVFELAAQLAHAEPVRERRVDVQRFARDGLLLLRLQVLERAHVVQAISQLDEDDAHIAHHGQQHLAHAFGLAVFLVGELYLVELGDALDDMRHLLAKHAGDVGGGDRCVFDRVMQQAGGDRCGVELHLREHDGDLKRVEHVGLARGTQLPAVVLQAHLPGAADDLGVVGRPVEVNRVNERGKALVSQQVGVGVGLLDGRGLHHGRKGRLGWRRKGARGAAGVTLGITLSGARRCYHT